MQYVLCFNQLVKLEKEINLKMCATYKYIWHREREMLPAYGSEKTP